MSQKKKQIRESFRSAVFLRDVSTCRKCGSKGKLDAHHITDRNEMPNGGYVKENGISLCEQCHEWAEAWHKSDQTEWVPGYRPDELYQTINSSHAQAMEASNKLK